jgi:hypothetical protein
MTLARERKKVLGILGAEGQSVQGAILRETKSRATAWTGLVVALTVSLSVYDAASTDLNSPGVAWSALAHLASFQINRPEQKAPCDLSFWRLAEDTGMSRSLLSSNSRLIDEQAGFQYLLSVPRPWLTPFSCRIDSFASPRAPPRMDPP